MALFLRCDGVDDYPQLPTMTVHRIVIDGLFYLPTKNFTCLIDAREGLTNGYISANMDGTTSHAGGVLRFSNNVAWSSPSDWGFRRTVEIVRWNAGDFTDDIRLFGYYNNNTGYLAQVDVWDIKLYNQAGTLVAHYDMSTGTMLDQTGNGNHATLVGGTWLDDGTGGSTGTDHALTSTVQSTSSSTASLGINKGLAGSIQSISSSQAGLSLNHSLGAVITSASSSQVALGANQGLSGSIQSSSDSLVSLSINKRLSGTGVSTSSSSANLTTETIISINRELGGVSVTVSSSTATLRVAKLTDDLPRLQEVSFIIQERMQEAAFSSDVRLQEYEITHSSRMKEVDI